MKESWLIRYKSASKIFAVISILLLFAAGCAQQHPISSFEMMQVGRSADTAERTAEQAKSSSKRASQLNQELESVVNKLKSTAAQAEQCASRCNGSW